MRHKKIIKIGSFGLRPLLAIAAVIGNCLVASAGITNYKSEPLISITARFAVTPVAVAASAATFVWDFSQAIAPEIARRFHAISVMEADGKAIDPIKTSGIPSSFFGTVAIPFAAINVRGQWDRVRVQRLPDISLCSSKSCDLRVQLFSDAVKRGKRGGFADKLAIANDAANNLIKYQNDIKTYGSFDYWASAAETIKRGAGDCEDFAILKQTLLRAMGVPDKSLSIIVLRDNSRNLYHAVLGVSTNQGHLILDNVRGQVFRDTQVSNYQPLFSFSGGRSWIHGMPAGKSTLTARAHITLDNVAPGESAAMPVLSTEYPPLVLSQLRPSLQN